MIYGVGFVGWGCRVEPFPFRGEDATHEFVADVFAKKVNAEEVTSPTGGAIDGYSSFGVILKLLDDEAVCGVEVTSNLGNGLQVKSQARQFVGGCGSCHASSIE